MQCLSKKCRCCLQEGEHTLNISDDLFMNMFRETLNISPISDLRLPRWICPSCFSALKEAKRFRDMVMVAERLLLQAINTRCDQAPTTEPIDNVWIKEEARDVDSDSERDIEDPMVQPSQIPESSTIADVRIPDPCILSHEINSGDGTQFDRKSKGPHSAKSAKMGDSGNSVRDIDVETIQVEIKAIDENATDDDVWEENDGHSLDGEATTSNTLVVMPDVKSMLDNYTQESNSIADESGSNTRRRLTGPTKLRENIILLMQHTTIIPFRHNNNYIFDFICYYCEDNFESMAELREHTELQHVGKLTDETILMLMRNRAHKLINADISCIKCRLCSQQGNTLEGIILHLTKEHRKVYHKTAKRFNGILGFVLSGDVMKCHLCNNIFESFRALYSHMNEHYEAYICYYCQKKFVNQLVYRTHLRTHTAKEDKDFKCDHCPANCKTKNRLVYHMKRHHLNVTLKCEQCPETFRFKEYRKRDEHMLEVHGVMKKKLQHKYTCDICQNGKTYSSRNTLKIHKSNVHKVGDVLRLECELCDFVTHHTKRMREHMDIHNGVKNYGCDLCGKKFTKPYTLRVHMRMHLKDKRYSCSQCEAAFVHKNVLQMHVRKTHPVLDVVKPD